LEYRGCIQYINIIRSEIFRDDSHSEVKKWPLYGVLEVAFPNRKFREALRSMGHFGPFVWHLRSLLCMSVAGERK